MNLEIFNSYETALKTACITQQLLFPHYLSRKHKKEIWHSRVGKFENKGRHYDVYEFENPITGTREKIYFDITFFFGRGSLLLQPTNLNLPDTTIEKITIKEMFGEQLVNEAFSDLSTVDKEKLNSTLLHFHEAPSDEISNYVAMYDRIDDLIEVLPDRRFHELGFPILHGFNFYILFVVHQLTHVLLNHEFEITEATIKGDVALTIIGEDCISFTPLDEFAFANDFVNYLFWTHKPNAFENQNEQQAFKRMVKFAFVSKFFTKEELWKSVSNSKADERTEKCFHEMLTCL